MTRLHAVPSVREQGCARVRRFLDSYLSGELTVETNHEILDHLSRCAACQAEAEARERLRASVRRVAAGAPEPEAAFEALVRDRVRAVPATRPIAAALALAAAVVLGLSILFLRPAPVPIVDSGAFAAAAATQIDCALTGDWPEKPPDLASLLSAVEPAYRQALRAVAAKPGFRVVAAHDCGHGGPLAFHLILRKDGRAAASGLVSVLVFRKTKGSLPPATQIANENGVVLTGARSRGFDIASTETARSLLFVVSANGRKESVELGRSLLPGLAATL